MMDESRGSHRGGAAAFFIFVVIAFVIGIAAGKETGFIDASLAKRAIGVVFGGILVITGNVLPKLVRPLAAEAGALDPFSVLTRFAGWAFVLAGLVIVAIWLLAPHEHAMLGASITGLGAFALVGARGAMLSLRNPTRDQQDKKRETDMTEKSLGKRTAIFLILHALLWVFGMFAADAIWGDRVAQWVAIIFVWVQGLLVASVLIGRPKRSE